jgi:hypothetical protein
MISWLMMAFLGASLQSDRIPQAAKAQAAKAQTENWRHSASAPIRLSLKFSQP